MFQSNTFSNTIVLDFSPLWPPKTDPKSIFFWIRFENVDFVKIMLPSRRNWYFWGFEPPKMERKSMQTRIRKKHRKQRLQHRFLRSFSPPKPSKIPPKSDSEGDSFFDAMETARNSSESGGSQSFGTVSLVTHMIRSALSVSLSLCLSVSLSVSLSLCWAAPRRPNP